jgi:hypothetical protein
MSGFDRELIARRSEHEPRQFHVVNATPPPTDDATWSAEYFSLSGYFGPHNPNTFAAAPQLLEELDCRVGELVVLRKAIEAGDPKRELFIRIDDMLRQSREAIAKATAVVS